MLRTEIALRVDRKRPQPPAAHARARRWIAECALLITTHCLLASSAAGEERNAVGLAQYFTEPSANMIQLVEFIEEELPIEASVGQLPQPLPRLSPANPFKAMSPANPFRGMSPNASPSGNDERSATGQPQETNSLPLREPPTGAEQQVEPDPILQPEPWDEMPMLLTPWQVPVGFSGPSGIAPLEEQQDSHFIPVPDRWRIGYPNWDRYGPDHSVHEPQDLFEEDAPYARGWLLNPFRQNVIKGDYPIVGQHTFLNLTATSFTNIEFRQVPTATTPFETTPDPGQEDFFGDPDQFFFSEDLKLSFEIFHGDAGFKPFDWKARITPILNANYLDVEELAVVTADARDGTTRYRTDGTIEEAFVEAKLLDVGPNYDFVSTRLGSQPFNSDFRGFIFTDINRAARLFGTRHANRDQWNLIVFDQREKNTNSALNTFDDTRNQVVAIANYYRQDFVWPGYTAQASVHYNHDRGDGLYFDRNDFLARPDPVGVFTPHTVEAVYFGLTGDGHINRYNISNAFYYVVGRDDLNPLAGQAVTINAYMAAAELSYDRDWVRFRTSVFWASGDDDITDDRGRGFDAIFDNPAFAGGEFSYWQRQSIKLLGVNLVDRFSLIPHLRSSKIQGQTNFVNPGLFLLNFGADFEVTPRTRLISNANLLWFDDTAVLEQFVFQTGINRHIGTDLSLGFERRPLLNDNIILVGGVSTLLPASGFKDLYDPITGGIDDLFASFLQVTLTY